MPKRVSLFELPLLLSLNKHCSTNNIFHEPFFLSLEWSLLMMSMVHCYVLWAQGHTQKRQWIIAFFDSTTIFLEFVVGHNNWLTTIWDSSLFKSLCWISQKWKCCSFILSCIEFYHFIWSSYLLNLETYQLGCFRMQIWSILGKRVKYMDLKIKGYKRKRLQVTNCCRRKLPSHQHYLLVVLHSLPYIPSDANCKGLKVEQNVFGSCLYGNQNWQIMIKPLCVLWCGWKGSAQPESDGA